MKNQVIEVLNTEHGQKVKQYWDSKGYPTQGFTFSNTKKSGNIAIYYGVIDGNFSCYAINEVKEKSAEIIELPEENEDPYKEFREAFERGETIQIYIPTTCKWVDVDRKPFFSALPECYRVKPKEWKPKRGERVLVWDNEYETKKERIFLVEITGSRFPICVVGHPYENEFLTGGIFQTDVYKNMSTIPEKVKVTKKDIADWKGVEVEQIEIV